MGTVTPSTISTSTTNITNSTVTTTTSSSSTTSISNQVPFQVLEITLISAQDLSPVSKSMRTYAVVWVHSDRKLTTRIDNHGHENPTWNDKLVFRVDDEFLNSDASAVLVEIYTASWFRPNLVGTVRVLVNNLIPPFARRQNDFTSSTRFVALQVRRASGSPQGILNMGVSLADTTMRCIRLYTEPRPSRSANGGYSDLLIDSKRHKEQYLQQKQEDDDNEEEEEEEIQRLNAKIQLWRSRTDKSDNNSEDFPRPKGGSICNGSIINGSVCNGSIVNGSELCSDVGPSASVVAAAIAKGLYPSPATYQERRLVSKGEVDDGESSILEDLTIEEAKAKGYKSKAARRRTEFPETVDHYYSEKEDGSRHSRRHSDSGLFSCFAYGVEFTIKCGANKTKTKTNNNNKKKKEKKNNNDNGNDNNNNNNNRRSEKAGPSDGGDKIKPMKRSSSRQNVSICCKSS